jgi:predicted Fe-Mo cluster-binding NifX family protein
MAGTGTARVAIPVARAPGVATPGTPVGASAGIESSNFSRGSALMATIAVTAASGSLDDPVDPRFGRAPYILLVDPRTMAAEVLTNPGRDAAGGAGVRTADFLASHRVDAVVAGEFGPRALDALSATGIPIHRSAPGASVRDAVAAVASPPASGEPPRPAGERLGGWGRGHGRGRGRGRCREDPSP